MLISAPIEVEMRATEGAMKEPAAFVWDGRRYEIVEILKFWFDTGFGAQQRGKAWYTRRHRNCYRVLADDGQVYELYLDRGGSRREWHLVRQLTAENDGERRLTPENDAERRRTAEDDGERRLTAEDDGERQ